MKARIVSTRTTAEVAIADAYGAAKAKLPGTEVVRHLRDDAFGTFAAAGLPHRRIEAWHYTDLRSLMLEALPVAPKPDETGLGPINQELTGRPSFGVGRLVIVDGVFAPSLSDAPPDGVSVRSLADVLGEGRPDLIDLLSAKDFGEGDAILALNAAMMQDGVVIEVRAGRRDRRADRDRVRHRDAGAGGQLFPLAGRGRRGCKDPHRRVERRAGRPHRPDLRLPDLPGR